MLLILSLQAKYLASVTPELKFTKLEFEFVQGSNGVQMSLFEFKWDRVCSEFGESASSF